MDRNLILQTKQVDLVSLIESDLGQGKKSGKWVFFRCPFHDDHKPSLGVINKRSDSDAHWECFTCGKKGDAIEWLMEYQNKSFQDAVDDLASGIYSSDNKKNTNHIANQRFEGVVDEALWSNRALDLIARAEAALWNWNEKITFLDTDRETGKKKEIQKTPLEWLLSRGLNEDTIRSWRLGYIPFSWFDKPRLWGIEKKRVWIPKGILIPSFTSEKRVWYLKIRLPEASPCKYMQILGGKQALFMAQTLLEGYSTAVFCEGELDTLLCWQEAGDLAGFVSLGGASKKIDDISIWGLYLVRTPRRLLIYDSDEAGEKGAAGLSWLGNSRIVKVPSIRKYDKDVTDFFRSGGNLRGWLDEEIGKNG